MAESLAVVRSLGAAHRLRTAQDVEDFEQELLDQYLLAMVGMGVVDGTVARERNTLFEFLRFLGRPAWTARAEDADRYFAWQRRDRQLARGTIHHKAWTVGQFF